MIEVVDKQLHIKTENIDVEVDPQTNSYYDTVVLIKRGTCVIYRKLRHVPVSYTLEKYALGDAEIYLWHSPIRQRLPRRTAPRIYWSFEHIKKARTLLSDPGQC